MGEYLERWRQRNAWLRRFGSLQFQSKQKLFQFDPDMHLHRSRLLAFLAGCSVLAGLALPWKHYLYQGERGRATPIDHWGGETLEALLLAVLIVPLVVLAVLGTRTAAPRRFVAVLMLILGSLAFLLAVLLLGLFLADPKWDAGAGYFVQLLGAGFGLTAGILALRRGTPADPNRP
jgi:hypothetical protein